MAQDRVEFGGLKFIPKKCNTPIIISGGVGKSNHILNALKNKNVNAILPKSFEFIGDSLKILEGKFVNL